MYDKQFSLQHSPKRLDHRRSIPQRRFSYRQANFRSKGRFRNWVDFTNVKEIPSKRDIHMSQQELLPTALTRFLKKFVTPKSTAAVTPPVVLETFIKALPFIDPDSSRMVEWIWANRQANGLSTFGDLFQLPQKVKATHKDLRDLLKPHFDHFYSSDKLFRALRVNDKVVEFYVVLENNGNGLVLNIFGNEEEVTSVITELKAKFVEPKSIIVESLLGFGKEGAIVDRTELIESEQHLAHDDFYPWLDGGIDGFVEGYLKSRASVVLLIGDPGTGKSSFLRTLLFKLHKARCGIASNEVALMDPGLVSWLKEMGSEAAIGVEDADNLVAAREDHNHQTSMLLSYADGVVTTNSKIIISTNLSGLNKVDQALTRPGRTYKILQFRLLDKHEANTARAAIGLPALDFSEYVDDQVFTLAEALNFDPSDTSVRKKAGIGFTQK